MPPPYEIDSNAMPRKRHGIFHTSIPNSSLPTPNYKGIRVAIKREMVYNTVEIVPIFVQSNKEYGS